MTLTRKRGTFANKVRGKDLPNTAKRFGVISVRLPGVRLGGEQLRVEFESVDDGVVARDDVSGMFGEGSTLDEAISDLIMHLTISLQTLEERKKKLSPELAAELKRLEFLFGV